MQAIHRGTRLAALGALMTVVALASAPLAGCGGGGGDAASQGPGSPVPPPPPPPAEAAYVVAGVTSSTSGNTTTWQLQVFDPAHPATALSRTPMVNLDAYHSWGWLYTLPATSADPAAGTITTLGQSTLYFVNQLSLWRVDLRGGHDHAPRRLGDMADVCAIDQAWPLTADGQSGWVQLRRLDSGGVACSVTWFVRTEGQSATAAVAAPGVVGTAAVGLEDASGLFDGLVLVTNALGTPALFHADRTLSAWHPVAGTEDAGTVVATPFVADARHPGQGWVATGHGVHAAHWDDSGLVLDALVHPMAGNALALVANEHGVAFSDGLDLYGTDGAAPATWLARGPGDPAAVRLLSALASPDQVWFSVGASSQDDPMEDAVGIWNAPLAAYTPAAADAGDWLSVAALGFQGDRAVVVQDSAHLVAGWWNQWEVTDRRLVTMSPADGSWTVLPGAQGVVRAAVRRRGYAADLVGAVSCTPTQPGGRVGACDAGALGQQDLAGGASAALGTVDTAYNPFDLVGDVVPRMVQGQPMVLTVRTAQGVDDLYLVVPGQAGSVKRLTTGGQ